MPAFNPMLRTISSTRPLQAVAGRSSVSRRLTCRSSSTDSLPTRREAIGKGTDSNAPIKLPAAPLSLQLIPNAFATAPHDKNLLKNATTITRTT